MARPGLSLLPLNPGGPMATLTNISDVLPGHDSGLERLRFLLAVMWSLGLPCGQVPLPCPVKSLTEAPRLCGARE